MIVGTPTHRETICAWLIEHGIDPMRCFHARIDFPRDDIATVTADCYAVNAEGKPYVADDGDVAIAPPITVPLQSFPPGV